jgi:hypothetical protein
LALAISTLFVSASAHGQIMLRQQDAAKVADALAGNLEGKRLDCEIERVRPFLDFTFRFEAGFVVRCPVRIFDGNATEVVAYARITSATGESIILGDRFTTPAIPEDLRARTNIRRLNNFFEMSGGFLLGEGDYTVEMLVADNRERFTRTRWKLKAALARGEEQVPLAITPNSASQLAGKPWDGKLTGSGRGVRLTVLLNAAPRDPKSTALRAWDRAFLLDSVSSLLRQTPCESVKLVAFNLEQQREIFRQEKFDRAGFRRLGRALRDLELGTVDYQVLKRRNGWADLLAGLANQEIHADEPAGAVVFLGPVTRVMDKIPMSGLDLPGPKSPRFFDFEYYPVWMNGSEFPDAVIHLTAARNGTVVRIHSPAELARGIQRMIGQLNLE